MNTNRVSSVGAVLLLAAIVSAEGAGPGRPLTIEGYSRDWGQWAGAAPDRSRWTPDGKALYFDWNPERADLPSLYVVEATRGVPRKVAAEQMISVPQPPPGRGSGAASVSVPSRDGSRMVWERAGDVFLLDVASRRLTRITNTDAAETSPDFSHDQQKVTFESGGNLYAYAIGTGTLTQLTRFRAGRDADAAAQSDYEKYLAKRQLDLFETLRHQDAVSKEQQARRGVEIGTRPRPTTLEPTQDVQDLTLSPDERYVTFVLAESSKVDRASASIEFPKYVTTSGLTEMQKLGTGRGSDPFREYSLGIVSTADGTVRYFDAKSLAGGKPVSWNSVVWSPDGKRAVAWAGSPEHKDLWLCALDVAAGTARPIFHDQDVNVPVQQAFMLVQRLQELKKTGWDIAVYPLEAHIPHLETSRLDMERRRFAFFEEVLKGARPSAAKASAAGR